MFKSYSSLWVVSAILVFYIILIACFPEPKAKVIVVPPPSEIIDCTTNKDRKECEPPARPPLNDYKSKE